VVNEFDLQAAIVAIAEADTDPGGLVELHADNPHPVVEWGDEGANARPITALHLEVHRFGSGTGNAVIGRIQLSVFVDGGAQGLESRILDRWEEVLRTSALADQNINGRIRWTGRPELSEWGRPGRRRDLEGEFTIFRG